MAKKDTKITNILWTHDCGCILKKQTNSWVIHRYCKKHALNYRKKADKAMKRRNKKGGRGYTKSNKKNEGE